MKIKTHLIVKPTEELQEEIENELAAEATREESEFDPEDFESVQE